MQIELSVVTTSYQSEKFIKLLVEKIEEECQKITSIFEIIIVDDCSSDGSWEAILEICSTRRNVRGIKLARNYGQQTASSAALEAAKGEYVILMDGDFENPLNLFGEIVDGLKTGNDIVYVTSKKRQDFLRKLTSSFFWEFCETFLKIKIVKNQLMLRGMTRSYVQSFLKYGDYIRNVAIINFDMGGRYKVLETQIGKRVQGVKSNSNFFKRFDHFVDLIILISNKPLTWIFFFGMFSFILSCLFLVYYFSLYFFKSIQPGFTSLIASIFLFGGLNLLILSFIGRYLANVYTEVRKRPLYRLLESINYP